MITPPLSIEITTRHQVYLERLKTSEAKKYAAFLKRMDDQIRLALGGRVLTDFARDKLDALVEQVRQSLSVISEEHINQVIASAVDLAEYEAGFEARSLSEVVQYDFRVPSLNQLRSAVLVNPLSVEGPNRGKLLEPFLRDMSQASVDRVANSITAGYYQGQTTNQILQTVRGTRAARFTDGVLAQTNRAATAMTRTALQHSAVQAREMTWRENSDVVKQVQWSSTLDLRTTTQCQALDGEKFPIDKGPRPPIHINCRSSIVPVVDERFAVLREGATRFSRGPDGVEFIDAKETYYAWLKRQPVAFQESAIGPTRARLLRNGGINAERFAELQLDRNFEPLTLDEMKRLEPIAFERAGID